MKALAVAVIAVGMLLWPASTASAAGVVELSNDGSSWSGSLSAPLFASTPQLVPMGSQSASFWVRNSAADDGYLRLTVENLSWSGSHYASALSMAASVPDVTGSPLTLGSSSGCIVLLEGVLLPAGQAVKVTTTLALGDLNGTTGQSGAAGMDIGVMLEQATSAAPAVGCNPAVVPPTTVVVVPPVTGARAPSTVISTVADPVAAPVDEAPVVPDLPGGPLFTLLANTLVRFDGSLVAWAAAGVPLGMGMFFLVGLARRKLRPVADEEEL
jgi:hypothetical protein